MMLPISKMQDFVIDRAEGENRVELKHLAWRIESEALNTSCPEAEQKMVQAVTYCSMGVTGG